MPKISKNNLKPLILVIMAIFYFYNQSITAYASSLEIQKTKWKSVENTFKKNKSKILYIKQRLVSNKLPISLIILPYIESNYNTNAVSYVGASGLWQLMPETAKRFSLEVSPLKDERFNFTRSTTAAISYLYFLYFKFNNNLLYTVASYNCGEARVEKAIKKMNGSFTYKKFMKLIPHETQQYVKKFFFLKNNFDKFYVDQSLIKKHNYLMSTFNKKNVTVNKVNDEKHISTIINKSMFMSGTLNKNIKKQLKDMDIIIA